MISIYAITELHEIILEIISEEDRLIELISLYDMMSHRPSYDGQTIIINGGEIHFPIDWTNSQPPYILPNEIALTRFNLLGTIYAKLGNYNRAYELLGPTNPSLYKELEFEYRLRENVLIDAAELISTYSPFEEYRLMHNTAILRHYASAEIDVDRTLYFYNEAIKSAPRVDYHAFSARHMALYLVDVDRPDDAEEILADVSIEELSEEAKIELKHTLCQLRMTKLSIPYDEDMLGKLKADMWEVLQFYEKANREVEAGLLLLDAAHIANISGSFSEALGYATRAVKIFDSKGLHELRGNALYRKGTLLYTWAQNNNPQFFKPAIETYQEALKVFSKERAPGVFADIHHNLGVLYTDMPSENTKKSIWAGVAVSSFEEALSFYTKEAYPYQYGMICNNYGNAFTKFPKAVLTDNHEKALYYYGEALSVRSKDYPYERAITLLNYLEASWDVGNDPDSFNKSRFNDMKSKALEVLTLVSNEDMIHEANKHLALLEQLAEASS